MKLLVNAEKKCRLCFTESPDGTIQSIFNIITNFDKPLSYADIVMSISTSVQIILGEEFLPEKICTVCSDQVVELYKFKSTIEQNEVKLRLEMNEQRNVNFDIDLKSLTSEVQIKEEDITNLRIKEENIILDNESNLPEEEMHESDILTANQESEDEVNQLLKCDVCKRSFKNPRWLRNHKCIHTSCKICNKKFPSVKSLIFHRHKHHLNKRRYFECIHCSRKFRKNIFLQEHLLLHCKIYKCTRCAKKFKSNKYLKQHMKSHDRQFKCEYCEKRFSSKHWYQKHLTFHETGERPFECDQCNKNFKTKRCLRNHRKLHVGNIKCDHCNRRFSQIASLEAHILWHMGDKPYECQQCDKKFYSQHNLTKHLKVHSRELLNCEHCEKKFVEKSSLRNHLKEHIKIFQCEHCFRTFNHRSHLTRHVRGYHPDPENEGNWFLGLE